MGKADPDSSSLPVTEETPEQFDQRMAWWKEARFGMFIHWGLYAIPAGEWQGVKTHGEWIRHTAQIPLETYDKYVNEFNPVEFDAEEWARIASEAGMKYMVITSKHHDGFCLWDSKETDFDIMSTPFRRDILKELSAACKKYGIRLGFYHSIMDWHHPDYIPARPWETNISKENADFDRYISYMKRQLKELATNYGDLAVFWYDGEWENTWTHEHGKDLYQYTRKLNPSALINNRVDKGRGGMAGMTSEGYLGDFGTPEQEIPDTGIPGVYWESCMTMNDHWGYNKANDNWKSTEDLIRNLVDIASKGGNFLLNVGPMANGKFPPESVERLARIGEWMKNNGTSIYGTSASPVGKMDWGRITFNNDGDSPRLFLHIFDWDPAGKKLELPGVATDPEAVRLLTDPNRIFRFRRMEDRILIELTGEAPDPINSVVEMVFSKVPEFFPTPEFLDLTDIFIDRMIVKLESPSSGYTLRYTTDGSLPTKDAPAYNESSGIVISRSGVVSARVFKGDLAVSGIASRQFTKSEPLPALNLLKEPADDISYRYYEGDWEKLPDFMKLKPSGSGTASSIGVKVKQRDERYGILFSGYITVPETGIYAFITESDDGSALYIDNKLIVDNDGLHGMESASGQVALSSGYHQIRISYFNRTGGDGLKVTWKKMGQQAEEISPLMH